jgi:hypothetical protein
MSLKNRVFNFTSIFNSESEYEEVKQELKQSILNDFSARQIAARIMIGDENVKFTIGKVLINLLIMKPLVGKKIKITMNDLFDYDSVTEDNLSKYFDRIIRKYKDTKTIGYEELKKGLSEAINEMSDFSGDLNVLAGNSISFQDFVRLSATDGAAKKMFKQNIARGLQFDEIEKKFNDLGNEIEDYFMNSPDTDLYPFMKSETGISKKQLTQAIGFVGLKPDIDGNVIPVAIEDNYLLGLRSLESYFINSKGTRKALIVNNRMVRRSGYLTRKLSLALIDRYHDHDNADCKTEHLVHYNVDNKNRLAQIVGRHYHLVDADGNKKSELKTIKHDDKSLVGKTIGLRSPVTCAGERVCRTCYGSELSEINKNINTGVAAVLFLTNPLTQKLLSAKHLLTTNTNKVEWSEGFAGNFFNIFTVNMNAIYFTGYFDGNISFNSADVIYDDEEEEAPYVTKIEINETDKKPVEYKAPVKLLLSDDLLRLIENDEENRKVTLSPKDYEEEPVFSFIVKNNELTKSLQQILELIESSGHLEVQSYHEMVNKFNELLIENELDFIHSVHAEMIISVLVKEEENETKRLDFSKKDLDRYVLVRASKAIMNAPLSVSLAFERLDEQLVNLDTYTKDGESLMDFLYK